MPVSQAKNSFNVLPVWSDLLKQSVEPLMRCNWRCDQCITYMLIGAWPMHIELIHVPTTGWSLHTTHSKYNNVEKCNFLLIKAQWFYKKFVEKSKLITNTNEPTVVANALNPRTKNIAWLHETNFMTKLVQLLSSMLWNTTTIFFISVYIYSDIKCATISIHKLRLTHRLPTFYIVAADVSLSSWCNAVSAMKTNEHTSHIIWRATYRRRTRGNNRDCCQIQAIVISDYSK